MTRPPIRARALADVAEFLAYSRQSPEPVTRYTGPIPVDGLFACLHRGLMGVTRADVAKAVAEVAPLRRIPWAAPSRVQAKPWHNRAIQTQTTRRSTTVVEWRNADGESVAVKEVDVEATIAFRGYVLAGVDEVVLHRRIRAALADAIEYHAPHLSDFDEASDGLIALVDGGSGRAVSASVLVIRDVPNAAITAAAVSAAVVGTTAWAG